MVNCAPPAPDEGVTNSILHPKEAQHQHSTHGGRLNSRPFDGTVIVKACATSRPRMRSCACAAGSRPQRRQESDISDDFGQAEGPGHKKGQRRTTPPVPIAPMQSPCNVRLGGLNPQRQQRNCGFPPTVGTHMPKPTRILSTALIQARLGPGFTGFGPGQRRGRQPPSARPVNTSDAFHSPHRAPLFSPSSFGKPSLHRSLVRNGCHETVTGTSPPLR